MRRKRMIVTIGGANYAVNLRDALILCDIASRSQLLRQTPDYRAFELVPKDEQEPFIHSCELGEIRIPDEPAKDA